MLTMVFTIHVFHGKQNSIFKCSTKRDFLTKVLKNYGIIKDELVLINKKSQKEIQLDDISDEMTVEIRARHAQERMASTNGPGPETAAEATHSHNPNLNDLVEKLTNNRVLTGIERKFLIEKVTGPENRLPNGKRSREEDVQMVNKKLQVDPSYLKITKNAFTQTDKISIPSVDQNNVISSASLIHESKLLAKKEKKDPKKVADLMEKLFNERRNFILMNNPVVSLIREKYPLLFSLSEVRNEFNYIIQPDTDTSFLKNISKYSQVILSLVDEDDSLLSTINDKVENCSTEKEKQYAREVGALLILSNVVKEKRRYLHTLDEPCEHNSFPRIEAPCKVKNLFYDKYSFRIVVENTLLCEATNFVEAALCLMASFFIFNISYPDNVFNTFVVMEKVFLEANDTDWNDIDDSTNQIIKLIKLKSAR